jgi:hypothetical protein
MLLVFLDLRKRRGRLTCTTSVYNRGTDGRHEDLKKRRQTWYLVMKVPAELQTVVGRQDIVKSLGTRDLTRAQKDRWPLVADWTTRFEVLRGNRQWTPAEIEEQAQREFHETLKAFAENSVDEDGADAVMDQEQGREAA